MIAVMLKTVHAIQKGGSSNRVFYLYQKSKFMEKIIKIAIGKTIKKIIKYCKISRFFIFLILRVVLVWELLAIF